METVEEHTPAHREYLKSQYAEGRLLMSGPFVPRTAGVLWAQAEDRLAVQSMIEKDPFWTNGIAEFEINEFKPVMFAEGLKPMLEAQN